MLRATWRSVFARKLRLFLSAFAVILGVAFVSGSYIFTDTLGRAFTGLTSGAVGDVIVRPGTGDGGGGGGGPVSQGTRTVPASLVDELATVPGAARADGRITSFGTFVVGKDGKLIGGQGPPGIAVNYSDGPAANGIAVGDPASAGAGRRPTARSCSTTRRPAKPATSSASRSRSSRPSEQPRLDGRPRRHRELRRLGAGRRQRRHVRHRAGTGAVPRRRGRLLAAWVTAAHGTSQEQLRAAVAGVLPDGHPGRHG